MLLRSQLVDMEAVQLSGNVSDPTNQILLWQQGVLGGTTLLQVLQQTLPQFEEHRRFTDSESCTIVIDDRKWMHTTHYVTDLVGQLTISPEKPVGHPRHGRSCSLSLIMHPLCCSFRNALYNGW